MELKNFEALKVDLDVRPFSNEIASQPEAWNDTDAPRIHLVFEVEPVRGESGGAGRLESEPGSL